MGRGEKSLQCHPGSELRLRIHKEGERKRRAKKMKGHEKKLESKKTKQKVLCCTAVFCSAVKLLGLELGTYIPDTEYMTLLLLGCGLTPGTGIYQVYF